MAYSKIILNGETLMDVTSDTVDAGNLLSGKTATKNSGAKVTGNIATKSSSDLTVSGATVTAPAGYYSATASKAVATTTHPNPTATIVSSTGVVTASHTQGTGYVAGGTTTGTLNLTTQAAQTINTSTADQTIASNRWLTGAQTIKSVTTTNLTAANIAEGVTVKVGDANNASRITQITGTHSGETQYTAHISNNGNATYCYVSYNGTKYYSNNGTFNFKAGDTLTIYCRGNDLLINGEEQALTNYSYTMTLPIGDIDIQFTYTSSTVNGVFIDTYVKPEGNLNITSGGYWNVYGYVQAVVADGSATTPAKTITTNPTMTLASTTGVVTAAYNGSSSITPTVTSGYVTNGTAGTVSTTGTSTFQLTSKATATYNTSTADQTVPSYRWLTGTQTIKSVTTSNLTAANIASGVVVKVGDANNASRITQVTGTYAPTVSNLTVTPTETSQTFNETGVYGYKPVTVKAISSTYVGTGVATRSSADVTFTSMNGTFTAPVGYYSTAVGKTITTQGAQTIYPSTSSQYISEYQWLTGSQKIEPVMVNYLTSDIIRSGYAVKIGYAGSMGYIADLVGTYDPEYYSIYKSLATASNMLSTLPSVSQFLDGLTKVPQGMFAYRQFSNGTYTFTNVSIIESNAFTHGERTGWTGYSSVYLNFPSCTSIGAHAFSQYAYIKEINCPICTTIGNGTFQQCGAQTINIPQCSDIPELAFSRAYNLLSISCSNCSRINAYGFFSCSKLASVYFPSCTYIGTSAFWYCPSLTSVNFSACETIGQCAFSSCSSLTTAIFPACSVISSGAFYQCYSLSTISFPMCQKIEISAFGWCKGLVSVTLPSCTSIGGGAFYSCSSLISINASQCNTIGNGALSNCPSLTTAIFPACSTVGQGAFSNCYNLSSINFSNCSLVSYYAFASCSKLTSVNLPMCQKVSNSAFTDCIGLTTISLPMCSTIETYAFKNCYNLLSLYLLGSSVVNLVSYYAFNSTPISTYTTSTGGVYGSIYVPASLYNTYKTTTNWSRYSSRFVSV